MCLDNGIAAYGGLGYAGAYGGLGLAHHNFNGLNNFGYAGLNNFAGLGLHNHAADFGLLNAGHIGLGLNHHVADFGLHHAGHFGGYGLGLGHIAGADFGYNHHHLHNGCF